MTSSREPKPSDRRAFLLRALPWTLLALAIVALGYRGVLPALKASGDLAVGYAGGRAWLAGENPYTSATLKQQLAAAGGTTAVEQGLLDTLKNVYFPTTLPVFAPLGLLPWPAARICWVALNVIGVLLIVAGLIRVLGWQMAETRSLLLAAFVVALAPVHSTMSHGQAGILCVTALVIALDLQCRRRNYAAGLLYGLATAIKVQIGLPFIAYLLWRRRWASAAVASLVLVAFTVTGIARMEVAGVGWSGAWRANLTALSTNGGLNDARRENPHRHSLLNLQYPLHTLTDSRLLANAVAAGAVGAATLATLCLARPRGDVRDELLAFSLVSVLCLLAVYHRTYDAVVLAVPIAWALSALRSPLRREAVIVLLLCGDFLLPTQTMLNVWQRQGRFPSWLTNNLAWQLFALSQQVWALLVVAATLLVAARRRRDVAPGLTPAVDRCGTRHANVPSVSFGRGHA